MAQLDTLGYINTLSYPHKHPKHNRDDSAAYKRRSCALNGAAGAASNPDQFLDWIKVTYNTEWYKRTSAKKSIHGQRNRTGVGRDGEPAVGHCLETMRASAEKFEAHDEQCRALNKPVPRFSDDKSMYWRFKNARTQILFGKHSIDDYDDAWRKNKKDFRRVPSRYTPAFQPPLTEVQSKLKQKADKRDAVTDFMEQAIASGYNRYTSNQSIDISLVCHFEGNEEYKGYKRARCACTKILSGTKLLEDYQHNWYLNGREANVNAAQPVSYTHLTLPTIYSV